MMAALFAAIAALAALAESSANWDDLRAATRRRTLESSAFGSRGLTRVLERLGAVHALPEPVPQIASNPAKPRSFDPAFSLDELAPGQIASVLGIDQKWIDLGVPTVSLRVDPDDLDELEGNLMGRGRKWERPAHFAWVEGGRVRFTSKVGVRIHGGGSRRGGDRHGYRIYFRNRYGRDSLPAAVFPTGGETPVRRVVLRADPNFANAMTHEIARQIGLPQVYSRPAAVFLNGTFRHELAVIERIDRQWLLSHYGHDSFSMARTKVNQHEDEGPVRLGPPEAYLEFDHWAHDSTPLDFAELSRRVDVDNLVRWTHLVQMTGIRDFQQGVALLDLTDPDARWHWIPWDLNISLGISNRGTNQIQPYLVSPRLWQGDNRLALVGRSLQTSDEFRSYYTTVLDEIYNHRLTESFCLDLMKRYRQIAERFGRDTTFLKRVRPFLTNRQEVVRRLVRERQGFGETHRVHVDVPPGLAVEIDGFDYRMPYDGLYTEGSRLRLGLPEATPSDVIAWQVGDRRVEGPEVEVAIHQPLIVRPILSREQSSAQAVEGPGQSWPPLG